MSGFKKNQVTSLSVVPSSSLRAEISAFVLDRRARGLSSNSITFYQKELDWFAEWIGAVDVVAITPDDLRRYMVDCGKHRNAGGCACAYRAIRGFLRWYGEEVDSPGWVNPVSRVRCPKVPDDELEPISVEDVKALVGACERRTFGGCRDRVMVLALLDTGCRASEFVSLRMSDVNLGTGAVTVRQGKGRKFRVVFLGSVTRRELGRYLRFRAEALPADPLWVTSTGGGLTYFGLREVIRRLAARAGIEAPSLHAFRRAFALACLRSGMDLISLQRLMGHSDLTVLRRYLNQTSDDLAAAHRRFGPVDTLVGG